jgi:hypothetical protein
VRINPYTLRFNLHMPEMEPIQGNMLARRIARAMSRPDSLGPVRDVEGEDRINIDSEGIAMGTRHTNTTSTAGAGIARRSFERAETSASEYGEYGPAPYSSSEDVESGPDYLVRMKLTVSEMENSFLADHDLKCLSQQRKILRVLEFFSIAVFMIFCFMDSGNYSNFHDRDFHLFFLSSSFRCLQFFRDSDFAVFCSVVEVYSAFQKA